MKRTYQYKHVGLSGLVFQEISLWACPYLPGWISANAVTSAGMVTACIALVLISINSKIAGFCILTAVFFDLLDGTIARFQNKASTFGQLLDAIADLVLYLCIISGLFITLDSIVPFSILLIYTLDLYLRFQLNHSPHTLEQSSNSIQYGRWPESKVKKFLKPVISPLLKHLDSLTLLAILLLINPVLAIYWCYYEFIRRAVCIFIKVPEIVAIYKS